jgi:hypothetical protein
MIGFFERRIDKPPKPVGRSTSSSSLTKGRVSPPGCCCRSFQAEEDQSFRESQSASPHLRSAPAQKTGPA